MTVNEFEKMCVDTISRLEQQACVINQKLGANNNLLDMDELNAEVHTQELDELPTAGDMREMARQNECVISIDSRDTTESIVMQIYELISEYPVYKCLLDIEYIEDINNTEYVSNLIDDLNYLGYDVETSFECSTCIVLTVSWE